MTARDDMHRDWQAAFDTNVPTVDYLISAGYRKPRTIWAAEELDALPVGAVVAYHDAHYVARKSWQSKHPRKDGTALSEWLVTGDDNEQATSDIALPATVLYAPGES